MIQIRPFELGDAGALLEAALASVEEVGPWLPWCHTEMKLSDVTTWIEGEIEARAEGTSFEFLIEHKEGEDKEGEGEEGAFLGCCGINRVDRENRVANLGYWVRSSHAGRGIVPRAVKMALGWAFRETNLERIEVLCAVENRPSQRVAEKIGAHREGIARSRFYLHGRTHDAVVYSIIRSEMARLSSNGSV